MAAKKRRRHSPEQIIRKLAEGNKLLAAGQELDAVCRHLEVAELTWHRWIAQYGGMKASDAKRLSRAGCQVNDKRVRRLWREEGLRVPQRRRKKRLTGVGVVVGAMSPIRPNVIWALDFQFDTTADGRTLKMLNVIDEFTREALTTGLSSWLMP
jgi:hypothetical protein